MPYIGAAIYRHGKVAWTRCHAPRYIWRSSPARIHDFYDLCNGSKDPSSAHTVRWILRESKECVERPTLSCCFAAIVGMSLLGEVGECYCLAGVLFGVSGGGKQAKSDHFTEGDGIIELPR